MGYQEDYRRLSKLYHPGNNAVFSDDEIEIINVAFRSRFLEDIQKWNIQHPEIQDIISQDSIIDENRNFTYPVIRNKHQGQSSEVIILFHGLNERSWIKYLPWGKALAVKTGHPVILFPISFHMNRSPEAWSKPRRMLPLVKKRKEQHPDLREASVANAAISNRLHELPQRFLISGLETYFDVLDLVDMLHHGKYPVLKQHSKVHFFGYSIGALLTQILMMTNKKEKFSDSKAFLFCGGTTLDKMQGASRYILDSAAFEALKSCYVSDGFCLKIGDLTKEKPGQIKVETAFSSMMNSEVNDTFRNESLRALKNKFRICALEKDDVIPAKAVRETYGAALNKIDDVVESMDFPFAYSHVTPFPCANNQNEVNQAFDTVFNKAAVFLK